MNKLVSLAFVVVAATGVGACKKGGGGGECDSAVNKAVDSMMADRAKSHPDMPAEMKAKADEMGGKIKAAMSKRCTEDKWAADITGCISGASSREAMKACTDKLPKDQQDKLMADMMGVMMGGGGGHMGGGMGMPGHPGGLHGADGSGAPAGSDMGSAAPAAPGSAGSAAAAPAPAGSAM